jgi:choline kinase
MKAIVLSAGQGRRLLPLTENLPKCLLPIQGETSALEFQLRRLAECGVTRATVMVGFGADAVERALYTMSVPGLAVETCYNPFFRVSDNLVTCWLARQVMTEDFILLNGDTLFLTPVLEGLLRSPLAPLTLAINHKPRYDDDDMKVSLDARSGLKAVGKTLDPACVNGESIGLMLFRGHGVDAFSQALDAAVRSPSALKAWYLSVINALTDTLRIDTLAIGDNWWGEVDSVSDLENVRQILKELGNEKPAPPASFPTRVTR